MTALAPRPDVLLVDDDPQVLLALAMLFDVMGWNAAKTRRSEEALALLRDRDFALVIVDLRMPEINGIELCGQIRSQNKPKAPLVFLLSGYIDKKSQAEAESSGAAAILTKPMGLAEMRTVLKKFGLPCLI